MAPPGRMQTDSVAMVTHDYVTQNPNDRQNVLKNTKVEQNTTGLSTRPLIKAGTTYGGYSLRRGWC